MLVEMVCNIQYEIRLHSYKIELTSTESHHINLYFQITYFLEMTLVNNN